MKKLLLILIALPMIGFGQEKKSFIIKDFNEDCFYLEKLSGNNKGKIGYAYFNTGEKMATVSVDQSGDWTLIYYYKNGVKKSEKIYYGCETEGGTYTSWWENGNLKYRGSWDGDSFADEWYKNGQKLKDLDFKDGEYYYEVCVTKEVTYYENGKVKSLFICPDCDPSANWDNCAPKRCFSNTGERIICSLIEE